MNKIEKETLAGIYKEVGRRVKVSPQGTCPVDMLLNFLRICHSQSCGKCVPCSVGLGQLADLVEKVLNGKAEKNALDVIESAAKTICDTSDCAIGYQAADTVLKFLDGFAEDFQSHLFDGKCRGGIEDGIPCREICPAHVDVPGYIALSSAGKFNDAMSLIRKDNPFPSVCGYICEHPCEARCRRGFVDDAVNICGIKRFASDHSKDGDVPAKADATGKKVAVIGGGPAGLTAAYFLSLMGHGVTVFEQNGKLGGMLRWGIPNYRLPDRVLDRDIDFILKTGINVELNRKVESPSDIQKIKNDYDAVFLSIGAHNDRKVGIDGEDAGNVYSAVKLLKLVGEGQMVDFKGMHVCVIGGGNVAMDATRTSLRLGAKKVTCVYRRRIKDMTALAEEIEEAQKEGVKIRQLYAPVRIEKDESGNVSALVVQKQLISVVGKDGRPSVKNADAKEEVIKCDAVVVAIGQAVNSKPFEVLGIITNRGIISADDKMQAVGKVFAGGDAVSGPATVIRAVAAGKTAAKSIDKYLGYNHEIGIDVKIPDSPLSNTSPCGRVEIAGKDFDRFNGNFKLASAGMSSEECRQECSRCLRCDQFGLGAVKGGRTDRW